MQDLKAPDLERLRYWQGQKLRRRDFQDQVDMEAQLRWWHNRALHQAYGVARGLEVAGVSNSNGSRIKGVWVEPGIAYDCFGRMLVLQAAKEIPLPESSLPTGRARVLVIRYKERCAYPRQPDNSSTCWDTRRSSFLEQPEFQWLDAEQPDPGQGVPLARIRYEQESDTVEPSLDIGFIVPRARALARPRIASGATIPGNTPWEPWEEKGTPIGVQVCIDTSAAGFTETPCYFAWLQGPLWQAAPGSNRPLNLSEFFPAPLSHIHDPRFNEFTFRLWGPKFDIQWLEDGKRTNVKYSSSSEIDFPDAFMEFAREQRLSVCWLAIQSIPRSRNQKI